jgi:hypothetical protein
MSSNSPPAVPVVSSGKAFQIRCEAGAKNHFGVQADAVSVTVGQRVRRDGGTQMWESVTVYAKHSSDGDLVVEVLIFNPDWDEPLRIASMRSRPEDSASMTPLVCGLDHAIP